MNNNLVIVCEVALLILAIASLHRSLKSHWQSFHLTMFTFNLWSYTFSFKFFVQLLNCVWWMKCSQLNWQSWLRHWTMARAVTFLDHWKTGNDSYVFYNNCCSYSPCTGALLTVTNGKCLPGPVFTLFCVCVQSLFNYSIHSITNMCTVKLAWYLKKNDHKINVKIT